MLSLYYGFWEYWNLYHKVTFDGINKLIIVNPGATQLDVQRDIYSAWKEWLLIEDNAKFPQALNLVGGEPTIQGQFLDATFFLLNGWRLKPQSGSYTLDIIGNLFDVDGEQIFIPADIDPLNPNNININTNTSVIVRRVEVGGGSIGEGGLTPEQEQTLYRIEDKVFQIENTLSQPLSVELHGDQLQSLMEIQVKLNELWKIHGLDPTQPTLVSKTGRVSGDITQTFVEDDGDVIIERVP